MKTIRFSGLVRLANGVQRALCGPVPQELRNQVNRALELVERTLGVHGVTLKEVPGPSRRAYEFLRRIDFDQIPAADDSAAPARHSQVVVRGLITSVIKVADRLAGVGTVAGEPLLDVRANLESVHQRVEKSIRRSNLLSEDLTPRSRQHLAWLRYVSSEPGCNGYVAAIQRSGVAFQAIAAPDRWPRPIVVHFRPTQSVFRARAEDARTFILLPTPMITLSDSAFIELARAVFGRRTRRRNAGLHAIMLAEPYQQLRSELESLGGVVEETRGMVHDLGQSFDRVSTAYFGGTISRPRLTWNRTITAGKFGHYHYASDTVMISRTLDRPQVPAFVVDHVMHHELLHKKHGLSWHNGRGHAHTAEFRREEREFLRFEEADQFLQLLARDARASGGLPLIATKVRRGA
jgi:hypothetical protein